MLRGKAVLGEGSGELPSEEMLAGYLQAHRRECSQQRRWSQAGRPACWGRVGRGSGVREGVLNGGGSCRPLEGLRCFMVGASVGLEQEGVTGATMWR